MIVRYDIQSNPKYVHPQIQFKEDGLKIIRMEASSYGGCWYLEIEPKENLPDYYTPCNWQFTYPEKKFATDL